MPFIRSNLASVAAALLLASCLMASCGADKTPAAEHDAPAEPASTAPAAPQADPSPVSLAPANAPQEWPWPDSSLLPAGPSTDQILYGEALIRNTFDHLGPEVADPEMRYSGNRLACGSCHLDGGRQRYGLSLIGAAQAYPRDMGRENAVRTLTQRINGCFERSMNGRALPDTSAEMQAMIAYIGFLSGAAPEGMDGRSSPTIALPDRAADPAQGAIVYATHCTACHGETGEGVRTIDSGLGYLYPPLWGPDSFNNGAGMHRVITAARFIRANMPLGTTFETPVLTEQEAIDVSAYINTQPRPQKEGLERDYPDRTRKPVDAPFPPYADKFSAEQHKFGPWQPILDARKAEAAPGPAP